MNSSRGQTRAGCRHRATTRRGILGLTLALAVAATACTETAPDVGVAAQASDPTGPPGGGLSAPDVWGDRVRVLTSGEVGSVIWRAFALRAEIEAGSGDEVLCVESESERFAPAPVCPGGVLPLNTARAEGRALDRPAMVLTDDLAFVVGTVEPGVAKVVVELASGAAVDAVVVGDAGVHYVAALPREAVPAQVVAYADSGRELDRRDFSASPGDHTYESPQIYTEYYVEEPPPCVEPDPDPALCGAEAAPG